MYVNKNYHLEAFKTKLSVLFVISLNQIRLTCVIDTLYTHLEYWEILNKIDLNFTVYLINCLIPTLKNDLKS